MHTDVVRPRQRLVEVGDRRAAGIDDLHLRNVGIAALDFHLEGTATRRHSPPDAPEADNQNGTPVEFEVVGGLAHEKIAATHRVVVMTGLLRRREHEIEGELGDRHGVGIAHRGNGNLPFGRDRQIDVVAADAVPRDDLEPGGRFEHLGPQRQVAQDEAVGIRNLPAQCLVVVPRHLADIQVGAAPQEIDACLVDRIVYDYLRHGCPAVCGRTPRSARLASTHGTIRGPERWR